MRGKTIIIDFYCKLLISLQVAVRVPSNVPRPNSIRELQRIVISSTVVREIQRISFRNVISGKFVVYFGNAKSSFIDYPPSATDLATAIKAINNVSKLLIVIIEIKKNIFYNFI